ncbi:hypothetical protein [Undibacterium sp. TJN19]|uniref:hypothetical protein n=1 Tax=Undibacterium sp. TJN19 TaxID=3413055 RepID=UPI003BF3644C
MRISRFLSTFLALSLPISLGALVGSVPADSQAQNLYRCGSSYQDKPCDNGQKGQVIGKMQTPSDKPALDPSCMRRGEEAKKIIWMREGGALQDKLLSEASSAERRKLIGDIYAQRGNALDIRARIESECMIEKENERKSAIRQSEEPGRSQASVPQKPGGNDAQSEAAKRAANDAASKKAMCDEVRKQLAGVQSSQRTGAQARDMDELTRNKREIESRLKDMGCDAAPKTTMQ